GDRPVVARMLLVTEDERRARLDEEAISDRDGSLTEAGPALRDDHPAVRPGRQRVRTCRGLGRRPCGGGHADAHRRYEDPSSKTNQYLHQVPFLPISRD